MSWLNSLASILGDSASTVLGAAQDIGSKGLDEASLIAQGFMDETRDPFKLDRFDSPPTSRIQGPNGVAAGGYEDPSQAEDYSQELLRNVLSAISAPARAVDRATNYYTGDTLGLGWSPEDFARPNAAGPEATPQGMRGNASQEAQDVDPISKLAQLRGESEIDAIPELATLRALQEDSARMGSADPVAGFKGQIKARGTAAPSDTFVARGDSQIMRGAVPEGQSAYVGEGFSQSNRPTADQFKITQLRKLGVPTQAAEAIVDQSGQEGARRAILELTSKSLESKQSMVSKALEDYQKNVAKADNKEAVLAALVMQLRNLKMSDPAIQMMLMSLGTPQA